MKWRDTDYHSLERRGSLYPSITYLCTMVKMLLIFISENRLKRSSVQVEVEHIRGSKRRTGKGAHK